MAERAPHIGSLRLPEPHSVGPFMPSAFLHCPRLIERYDRRAIALVAEALPGAPAAGKVSVDVQGKPMRMRVVERTVDGNIATFELAEPQ